MRAAIPLYAPLARITTDLGYGKKPGTARLCRSSPQPMILEKLTMASNGLPPRVTAGLYIAAGVMFFVGALASQRIAFSGVGVAFIALGAAILVRQRKSRD